MRHIIFKEADTYPIVLLNKLGISNKNTLTRHYLDKLVSLGIDQDKVLALTADYDDKGKASASFVKVACKDILDTCVDMGTKLIYVTDATYFKALTKQKKAEPNLGYALPCAIAGYEHITIVLGINSQTVIYNPENQTKLDKSLLTLANAFHGSYTPPGMNIIHSAHYPERLADIKQALDALHQYPELTVDIEAFSLLFNKAGIGSIAFAWDEHNGIAFKCDYCEIVQNNLNSLKYAEFDIEARYGMQDTNLQVRKLLKEFFISYKGKLTWHNSSYDIKVCIYVLWMNEDPLNYPGLLEGLEILTRNFGDTKILAYLALNSTAGNELGLKKLAQSFAGNWAQDDIKDIKLIKGADLLKYNLIDALSTFYVKNLYEPKVVLDNQQDIYEQIMLPSLVTIIQMELSGMPMCDVAIDKAYMKLSALEEMHLKKMESLHLVETLVLITQTKKLEKINSKLKKKQHGLEKVIDIGFNPASHDQIRIILYDLMQLPVIDLTDTKLPATGASTLEKLINHTDNKEYKEFLEALIGYSKVSKILNTFLPAFKEGLLKGDNSRYLHGSFNLGGTVTGRLSSSNPNMQNLNSRVIT